MQREKRPDELVVFDAEKLLILSMKGKKYTGWHENEIGGIVDEFDDNLIEISYREDDENGWDVGGDEFISTFDIRAMANCIRNVIFDKEIKSEYHCQGDILRISLVFDPLSEQFSFTVGFIETLMREYHITITKTELTRKQLDEYIQPFFEWERQFPVVDG